MNCLTKFHLEKIKVMSKQISLLTALFIFIYNASAVQIPEKPYPPRLVNDLAQILSRDEVNALENKLVEFSNSTTTQIVVVTVKSLNGEEKSMFATEIGHQWGVGQNNFDNGIVLLVKEKTAEESGEVFIATGYGLEAVIPDAIAKRIVDKEILPRFREGNYYDGIDQAVSTLMQLSLGEFTAKEYEEKTASNPLGFIIPLLFFLIVFGNIFGRANNMRRRTIGKNLPLWVLLSMMGSKSKQSGSFGDFSSGRGSFGGGGGGFGGFGGGGFGGGGAGGSW
jgi:uncharacterized protein